MNYGIEAFGPTRRDLRDDVREIAQQLRSPAKLYRTNPLEQAERDWETLRKQGKIRLS